MGFLDKVKEQAASATAVAKDAAQKGQAKLDDMQAKKAADALLRDLGVATYAAQTNRAQSSTAADAERLVAALEQYEETNGPLSLEFESSLLKAPAGGAYPPPQTDTTAAAPETPPTAAPQPPPPPTASKPPPPDAPKPPPPAS